MPPAIYIPPNIVDDLTPELGGNLGGLGKTISAISAFNGVIWLDGTTYAQTSTGLQAALNALGAGGGAVVIPPATNVVLTAGIIWPKANVKLWGCGASSIISATVGLTDSLITIGGANASGNFEIANLTFDGGNQTYSPAGAYGIEHDTDACGILIDDTGSIGCAGGSIHDCWFQDIPNEAIGALGRVAYARELYTRVFNNHFSGNTYRFVHFHEDHTGIICNNVLRDASGYVDSAIRHGALIRGNYIENFTSTNTDESCVIYCSDMECVCDGNAIVLCTVNEYGIHGWIGSNRGVVIRSNQIHGGTMAAAIQAFQGDTVDGNHIYSLGGIAQGISMAAGASVGRTKIVFNHISSTTDYGIYSDATGFSEIVENTIDNPESHGPSWAIRVNGAKSRVIGNYVETTAFRKYWFNHASVFFRPCNGINQLYDDVNDGYFNALTFTAAAPTGAWFHPYVYLDGSSNAVAYSLPDPTAWPDEEMVITAIDLTYACSITAYGLESITGPTQFTIEGETFRCRTDGTNWLVVAQRPKEVVASVVSSATPTPNFGACDVYEVTALAGAAEFGAPTGVVPSGQSKKIEILDDGTGRALTWNAVYRSTDVTLPNTTTAGKLLRIGFIYNSTASKWDCVATAEVA